MKSVIILTHPNYVNCPQLSIPVQYPFNDHKILEQICQLVSPRFVVSTRPYYKDMDAECVSLDKALELIQNAKVSFVDKYNYEEVDTWHIVADGSYNGRELARGSYKIVDGKIYQLKKEFQRCPLKYIIRNIADGSYLTIEKV